ncbi:hypothetical protein ELH43_36650 [Rhizobium ruizarguesonis]|uniref:protein kinase domain-containing protein n=1 Tax=Rhizobium ruizarguesonis TaxID=2081791 RepID=UPI001031F6CA|nr:protein kinase [Rhizobium ruizarguesonis]TBB60671.1 hypothetical protein ELH43_36650 [Rhizobium ruizarguesonis]
MAGSLNDIQNGEIGRRWCSAKGVGWKIVDIAGRGGTAPVFTVQSPDGVFALKLLDLEFSTGERREESLKRIQMQVDHIGIHDCPHLVQVYDGGAFEDRLFILMNKADGQELEKKLQDVPRDKIRSIIDQVAQACLFLRGKGLCHRDIKSANIFISDDFNHVTLLDVSVLREIYDPIGLGTDDGGKLPVVATSRYSPPEYLFRLAEPGEELWHALDIYQLGGLIHDLVMRQPMFEDEYKVARENRYRFAWIVATQTPKLEADDVEPAIILLGRRALDKDWLRRGKMALVDFLAAEEASIKLGLTALGFPVEGQDERRGSYAATLQRLKDIMATLDEFVSAHLHQNRITATHSVRRGHTSLSEVAEFVWDGDRSTGPFGFTELELRYVVSVSEAGEGLQFNVRASLGAADGSNRREVHLELPAFPDGDETVAEICAACVVLIGSLASKLVSGGSH